MVNIPGKLEMFYEGKAKKLYATTDPDLVIAYFKDDATAFNAKKRGTIEQKGVINNRMSELFFNLLEQQGVATHFVSRIDEREMLCRRLDIIPVETVVRKLVTDPLDDPLILPEHAIAFKWATAAELDQIKALALQVNRIMREFLDPRGILLVDFKLEFGRHHGKILLGDEICPDTCRFWDKATRQKLDKDRFRRDLGGVEEAYQEMLRRVSN